MATATANKSDVQAVDALAQSYRDLKKEIGKVIIGQEAVISLSSAEIPFGTVTDQVTQFFQPFSIQGNACIWEDF